jgi:hypothetical protein
MSQNFMTYSRRRLRMRVIWKARRVVHDCGFVPPRATSCRVACGEIMSSKGVTKDSYWILARVSSNIAIALGGCTRIFISAENIGQNLRTRPLPAKSSSLLGPVIPHRYKLGVTDAI